MANTGQILKDAVDNVSGRINGYANNPNVKKLDIRHGGLNGILPNVAKLVNGAVHGAWISATPATTGITHAVLMDYPKMFDMCGAEASKVLRGKLSALISVHAETIEGINDTYNWDYDDSTKVGRTSESIHEVTNATIVPTEPSIAVTEKLGHDIRDLLTFIGRYGIMDPYTGSNLAYLLPNYVPGTPWTLDMKSFSILVYEADATGTVVQNAQIVANMMPRTSGEWTMKKDINSSKEVKKYNIGFTGFGIRGREVVQVAQTYLNEVVKATRDALMTKSLYQAPVDELKTGVINPTLVDSAQNV